MSEKFKYAPGKPGYGTKGDRGEDGRQGLAMYFTSLNPNTQTTIINNKIANNLTLWPADEPLPDGRVYVTGDLFFDSDGLAYEINAETNTYQYKFASLNMGGFFVPLGKDTSNGFERYFNSNSSPKFIIDNVYTISGAIDYTAVPENIYDVQPKNFTRIEYTNIKSDPALKYNAFTVYTSGENAPQDNHKALAIVYNEIEKAFHIGNLDNNGYLRNTNLIFDVSLLRQKKEAGKNTFTQDTCIGAVLTNYEIKANSIFDPNFNAAPSSFYGTMGTTDCSINWVLGDFVNGATNVYGDLYFYENNYPYNGKIFSFINDVSLRPLIFSNVSGTGNVKITGINQNKVYSFYMKLYTDTGWVRNSDVVNIFKGTIDVNPMMIQQSSSDAAFDLGFDVNANFTWNASVYQNPDNFMYNIRCTSVGGLDGSILVDLTPNSSTNARIGKIKVHLLPGQSIYKDVSIYQPRGAVGPELFLYSPVPGGTSNFSYSTHPNYYMDASQNGTIKGLYTIPINVSTNHAWDIDVLPSWIDIDVTAGGPGQTTINLLVDPNYTLQYRNFTFEFNYGGTSPVYLTIDQAQAEAWIEYSGDRYDFPLNLTYSGYPGGYWQINYGPTIYGDNLYLNMRFTDGTPIDWEWPNAFYSWFNLSNRTGTGDTYGPTFQATNYPSTTYYLDGSAGGVSGYPLLIQIGS
ncbi:MAG: BACON domain-containing protein [Candidatus Methanofastidiosa archaeon]|nr:BACON domain-containing protein [Candidatus Methanofastidiosa archaeon]